MSRFLQIYLSKLNQPFRFRLWKYVSFLCVILIVVFFLGQQSELVEDWENRFQPNFYNFKTAFFPDHSEKLPIVLVSINDRSIPPGLPRSPLSRSWLADILTKLKPYQPEVIGFNILLDRKGEPVNDEKLVNAIKGQTVILRDNNRYPVIRAFSDQSSGFGNLRFKFDSSGTLHYVCNSFDTCRSENQFHSKILSAYFKKKNSDSFRQSSNWLKINYIQSNQKLQPTFPVIQADEIDQLPKGALKDKIVLIGTDFQDLYQQYRVPSGQYNMQEIEVLAHALNAMANHKTITIAKSWEILIFAAVLIGIVAFIIYSNNYWLNMLVTIVVITVLFVISAVAFAVYQLEIPFVSLALLLILLLINHSGLLHFHEKVDRLETELKLKQSKIDFLTNELHAHSLFNELSRLSVMIRQNPAQAREYLVEFAEMLRTSLKYGDQLMVPVSDQLDYLKSYLRQQQLILGDLFHIDFSTENLSSDIKAPWHIFYPFVENAVKYTESFIKNKKTTGTISIKMINDGHRTSFTITNPFIEGAKVASSKTGLRNLKNRLDHIYGVQQYQLTSEPKDTLWVSTLDIPTYSKSSI